MRLFLGADTPAVLEDVWLLFSTSGSFSPGPYIAQGYTKLDAHVVGGGGSGGSGGEAAGDRRGAGGGGGGGGGYRSKKGVILATLDTTLPVVVGKGGKLAPIEVPSTEATGIAGVKGGTSQFLDINGGGGGGGGPAAAATVSAPSYGGSGGGGGGTNDDPVAAQGSSGVVGGADSRPGGWGGSPYFSNGEGGKGADSIAPFGDNDPGFDGQFWVNSSTQEVIAGGGGGGAGGNPGVVGMPIQTAIPATKPRRAWAGYLSVEGAEYGTMHGSDAEGWSGRGAGGGGGTNLTAATGQGGLLGTGNSVFPGAGGRGGTGAMHGKYVWAAPGNGADGCVLIRIYA